MAHIISVELVDASALPRQLDAFAVHKPGDVTFVVRDDYNAQQITDAIGRLGYEINREAVDATYRRGASTSE